MFAAEFGYSWEYVLKEVTMADYVAHMEYRESNTPAGALIKAVLEAFKETDKPNQVPAKPSTIQPAPEGDKPNLQRFLQEMQAAGFTVG
jgi:hypothetical protein